MIQIKSETEINILRQANRIVAQTLFDLEQSIKPGVTTQNLDAICEKTIVSMNGRPAFKGYKGFPSALCISVNEEIVHGIPGPRKLKEGDIVSCDVGAYYKEFYGDAAATFAVGQIDEESRRLINVTREALSIGIKKAVAGNRLYDISYAIQEYVERSGFSVVRVFVGHGIGRRLHEDPQIPNFGEPGRGVRLKEGMVLAIEPMVNAGRYGVKLLKDGWTAVTEDGKFSAHFEHSIVVREGQAEILSILPPGERVN